MQHNRTQQDLTQPDNRHGFRVVPQIIHKLSTMTITTYLHPDTPIELSEYHICHLIGGHKKKFQSSLYAVSKEKINGKKEWRIIALRNGGAIKEYIEKNSNRNTITITREMDKTGEIQLVHIPKENSHVTT